MVKFIFHFDSPWRIVKRILISLIPFLFLTACSGGPFVTEFETSFSGEGSGSPGSGPSPPPPPPGPPPPPLCGPEGPIDPEAAGFLCEIITSAGSLDPSFDPDETTYTLALPFSTLATYTITFTSGDPSFTLTLNGNPINSGEPVQLTPPGPGLNSAVTIRVRDTNGNETVYEITVNRTGPPPCGPEGPNDPGAAGFLCDLIASSGTLDSNFDPDDITYTLTLPFLTLPTYTMTSTSGDPSFTLTLNGNPINSGDPVDLTAPDPGGSLLVTIRVKDTNENETVYEITVERQSANDFAQQAYLKESNTDAGDTFGQAVAISGDTIVVGAFNEGSNATGVDPGSISGDQFNNLAPFSGAAYVFVRNEGIWSHQAYLKASNTDPSDFDQFGRSIAISGDTIVVGAWLESSNATGVNGDGSNNSAPRSGAAYVFVRSGTIWTQQAYLKASNTETDDRFGESVAIEGDTIVVGADFEDSNARGVNGSESNNSSFGAGAAYVFVRSGTTWSQQAYLKASNTEPLGFLSEGFGFAVAISGNTIVVGANSEYSGATGVNGDQFNNSVTAAGAAYVFVRSGTTWSQQAYLKASNTGGSDHFGDSVAISGDTIVVGAFSEDSNATGVDPGSISGDQSNNSASNSGAAYVFVRSGTTWSPQAYLKASNTGGGDRFGGGVGGLAIEGDTIVVGAYLEDSNASGINEDEADNSALDAGAAYVFVRSGTIWTQQAYLKASNTDANDSFGLSVGISGDTIVGLAFRESSNATGVGGDQSDNSAFGAGAGYVFQ